MIEKALANSLQNKFEIVPISLEAEPPLGFTHGEVQMKSLQQESARNGLNGQYVENRRPNTKGRKA